MGFLGRNINLALVALILAVVVLAIGTTVLYQRGLQERTEQYETTSQNLTQCLSAVENYRDVIEQREAELNDTSADIQKYDTLYSQKVAELKDARDELSATQGQLNSMTLQKEQFKELYSKALLNVSGLERTVSTLNARIGQLEDRIDDLEWELDQCEAP